MDEDKVLGDVFIECGAVKFGDFTLASGRKSRYYVDIKKAITKPEILKLISRHIVQVINNYNINVDYIACVELGGVPIGTIVSVDTGLPLLIIRKAEKDHGLKSRIVGDVDKKKVVLLVEDVTTTGGSVVSAVQALKNEGLIVKTVISVVDRDEGAQEALEKEELDLISLVKAKTLLEDYEVADALRHSNVIINEELLQKGKGK